MRHETEIVINDYGETLQCKMCKQVIVKVSPHLANVLRKDEKLKKQFWMGYAGLMLPETECIPEELADIFAALKED